MKRATLSNTSNKENGPLRTTKPRRIPLADITNDSDFLRRELQNELTPPSAVTSNTARHARTAQNSGSRTPSFQNATGSTALSSNTNCVVGARSKITDVIDEVSISADEASLEKEPLLSPVNFQTTSRPNFRPSLHQILSDPYIETPGSSSASVSPREGNAMAPRGTPGGTSLPVEPQPKDRSSGHADRQPWSALQVPPKTHKTSLGQVIILPSHSTLVDYREGERRKGRKGDEIMLVSPDGRKVQIFSAPHLSTPCCLAEPNATYALNDLPTKHYKLYEQARKAIERIKKKIPKLVLYETDSTCTLMSNDPLADLQVTLDSHSPSSSSSNPSKDAGSSRTNTLRLCLSRKLHTIEISSSVSSSSNSDVGEWNKKVMFWAGRGSAIDRDDYALLSAREKEGMKILFNFLPIVDAVESSSSETPPPLSRGLGSDYKTTLKHLKAADRPSPDVVLDQTIKKLSTLALSDRPPIPVAFSTHSSIAEPSSSRSFSALNIVPRPRLSPMFPPMSKAPNDTTRKASSTVVDPMPDSYSQSAATMHAWFSKSKSGFSNAPAGSMDMRFIPTVGWCIRYGTDVYRIMFFDGAALEVDVRDERVEFVNVNGQVERSTVRDCHAHRSVGERMKVFEDFVSMFDDSER
ncbi:hypothetical protein OF83DRAFT_1106368 [Amylostereum chailletii]|nr:hypothetical protein OF83DRAFT_1106368 [Amylostereum chailletii]